MHGRFLLIPASCVCRFQIDAPAARTLYTHTHIYLSIIMDTGFEFKFLSCIHTISEKARDTHQIMNIYVNIVQHYARSAQLEKYAALYPSCAM